MTFGIAFLITLIGTTVYAIGRTVYERINPPVDYRPVVIPFSDAVRYARRHATTETTALRERIAGEASTVRIVLPWLADGTPSPVEKRDPGAVTVDLAERMRLGRHRRADTELSGAA